VLHHFIAASESLDPSVQQRARRRLEKSREGARRWRERMAADGIVMRVEPEPRAVFRSWLPIRLAA